MYDADLVEISDENDIVDSLIDETFSDESTQRILDEIDEPYSTNASDQFSQVNNQSWRSSLAPVMIAILDSTQELSYGSREAEFLRLLPWDINTWAI